MREHLRVFIAACFYYSGLTRLALWWSARTEGQLIILNYHRAEGNLEAQMRYLSRYYRVMHLEEALEELYATRPDAPARTSTRDGRIPLVLTFDDGYTDNYTRALPLAQKFQVPVTIFVIPGYVESGQYFWWMAAKRLLKQFNGEKVKFAGQSYQLSNPIEREALIKAIDGRVRYASSVAEREALLAQLQQELGVSLPGRSTGSTNGTGGAGGTGGDDDAALPMTWEQIREMEKSGLVSFGAHTMHHPLLSALSDEQELLYETGESRRLLEQKLDHPVRTFAYPIGKPRHFADQGVQAVKSAGFTWALTTIEDINTNKTDPYLLGRLPGDTDLHWMVMAAELAGLLGIVSRFRKKYAELFRK
ncbi:MAG: hypothetical protein NVS4B9_10810 [Ktedonobacteraceae bacterium]